MPDVNVKNQSSNQSSESTQQGLQRQPGGGSPLSRRQGWDPFFRLSPAEFLNANPFTLMRRMSEEMDRAFGQFWSEGGAGERVAWNPPIEISEHENNLQVHAELPGLKPEEVKVELTDDALIIHGERKREQEHHIGKAYRSERRYGQFYREIALPEGVNPDQVKAQFRDGVLEITLPLPTEARNQRRQIPVQTAATGSTETAGQSTSAQAAGAGSQGGATSSAKK